MLDFQSSPLVHIVNEVTKQQGPAPQWRWKLQFKVLPESGMDFSDKDIARTESEREGFFTPVSLINLDFIGDFEKGFCDHINCVTVVGMGLWLKVLAPHREYLRVYLTRTRLKRQGGDEDMDDDPLVLTFKPIFKDTPEAYETVGDTMRLSRHELDVRGILNLEMDLLDDPSAFVQSAQVGGIFRKHTCADVLQALYAMACEGLQDNGQPLVLGQVLADRTNADKREHINIEAGTPLVDLPMLLQERMGGIWSTGCSRYLYNKKWYFYPCYDTTRIDREQETLTIVRVPETVSTGAKHTFLQDGTQLKLIAGSDSQIKDLTQQNFLQQGDGVRFSKAGSVLDGWLEVKDNKAVAKRTKNNSEVRMRADGQTDHRTNNSDTRFTDNPLQQYALLASRRGQLLSFVWNYADHTLIRPGMACRVMYEDRGEIKELNGVVVGRHAAVQTTQKAASTGDHMTTCALFVFCNEPLAAP